MAWRRDGHRHALSVLWQPQFQEALGVVVEPLAEARRVGLDTIVIDHHMAEITLNLPQHTQAADVCYSMSKQAEALQLLDFPANRAMHEIFQEQLTIDPRTKDIFMACVALMRKIQALFLPQTGASDTGAFAAAQLLFTLDYNFVLKAMPGFPRDPEVRHRLIGRLVAHTLEI